MYCVYIVTSYKQNIVKYTFKKANQIDILVEFLFGVYSAVLIIKILTKKTLFRSASYNILSTGNQTAISRDKVTKSYDNSDEDDSWDKMFDDDGDCLDPNSLKEVF